VPVIAMTMELGVRGNEVADGVARSLGISVVSNELAERVAGRAKIKKSYVQRLREGKASLLERLWAPGEKIALYTAEEVFDVAHKGDVLIRGWGSTLLLRPVSHIPCIRVCASMESRIRTLMTRLDTDDEAYIRAEIEAHDEAHAAAMQSRFKVKWGDPLLYDLTLNTARLSIESCVDQVVALTRRSEFRETASSRARLADLALEARVRAAFLAGVQTQNVDVSLSVDGGKVTLRGMVEDEAERKGAGAAAAKVKGVTQVVNELRAMRRPRR
jgi:osmotically-inducible protein OsmY